MSQRPKSALARVAVCMMLLTLHVLAYGHLPQERLAPALPWRLPPVPQTLTYEAAVERIEWAYRCGYVASTLSKMERYVQPDGTLYAQVLYPMFANRRGFVQAPGPRLAPCLLSKHLRLTDYVWSQPARPCALRRHQAYLEGYLTAATYLKLQARHLAPLDLEYSGEMFCYP